MTDYLFQISLECPHCRTGVPVNGIGPEVLCSGCLKPISLDDAWWKGILDAETVAEALKGKPGEAESYSRIGGLEERVAYGNRKARCQGCKTDFPLPFLQEAAPQGGGACPTCQQHVRVRPATALAKQLMPEAEFLVNEDAMGEGLGKEAHHTVTPVVFACMSCGAALKVDGSTRTPHCNHCGNDNYLPDPLWLRLHPAATAHVFFVTRNVGAPLIPVTADNLPAQLTQEMALRILKEQDPHPKVLKQIFSQCKNDQQVMMALVKEPKLTEPLLLEIAELPLPLEAQMALAQRPRLPAKVMEKLLGKENDALRSAMLKQQGSLNKERNLTAALFKGMPVDEVLPFAKRKDFPEWKLLEMAPHCTPSQAEALLLSPKVSEKVLRALGANKANRAAVRRHSLFTSFGFFKRLFFFSKG